MWLGIKIVAFTRDLAEDTLTPMVLVEHELWYLQDLDVVSEAEAAMSLMGLSPIETAIPENTTARDNYKLSLSLI